MQASTRKFYMISTTFPSNQVCDIKIMMSLLNYFRIINMPLVDYLNANYTLGDYVDLALQWIDRKTESRTSRARTSRARTFRARTSRA